MRKSERESEKPSSRWTGGSVPRDRQNLRNNQRIVREGILSLTVPQKVRREDKLSFCELVLPVSESIVFALPLHAPRSVILSPFTRA